MIKSDIRLTNPLFLVDVRPKHIYHYYIVICEQCLKDEVAPKIDDSLKVIALVGDEYFCIHCYKMSNYRVGRFKDIGLAYLTGSVTHVAKVSAHVNPTWLCNHCLIQKIYYDNKKYYFILDMWVLPVKCENCNKIIRSEVLQQRLL